MSTNNLTKSSTKEVENLGAGMKELTVNESITSSATISEKDDDSEDCISAIDDDSAEEDDEEVMSLEPSGPTSQGNENYIKVESTMGDRVWNILVLPNMTVRDVIEKLRKRVDDKYKFFELHQYYEGTQRMLLNPEIKVSWIIAAWSSNPHKFRLVFDFQETKYAQIESMVDGHKWQIKLGPGATVEEVCSKLALRMDSKFNLFQLYEVKDKATKKLLDPKDKVFELMARWGPHAGRHKLMFHSSVKDNTEKLVTQSVDSTRRPTMEKLPAFKPPKLVPKESFVTKKRGKFSSTSTLYAVSTISKPDIDELLHCMAKALMFHIEKGCRSPDKIYYDIFDEKDKPLVREHVDFTRIPPEMYIYDFVKRVYDIGRLDPECVIMALAYIEKLIEKTGITIDTTNWRKIAFIALAVALKTWEDLAVYNLEFVSIFHGKMSIKELNVLEMQFLALLEYSMYIPASLYAKYYFQLRQFSKVDEAHFPLKPIDKETAKLLEVRTQSSSKISQEQLRPSFSMDTIKATKIAGTAILG